MSGVSAHIGPWRLVRGHNKNRRPRKTTKPFVRMHGGRRGPRSHLIMPEHACGETSEDIQIQLGSRQIWTTGGTFRGTNAISFASLAPNHDRFSPLLTINFLTVYYVYVPEPIGYETRIKELHFYTVNTVTVYKIWSRFMDPPLFFFSLLIDHISIDIFHLFCTSPKASLSNLSSPTFSSRMFPHYVEINSNKNIPNKKNRSIYS